MRMRMYNAGDVINNSIKILNEDPGNKKKWICECLKCKEVFSVHKGKISTCYRFVNCKCKKKMKKSKGRIHIEEIEKKINNFDYNISSKNKYLN